MWNSNDEVYCDGICTDPAVNGTGSVWSNMMSLWLGLVPEQSRNSVRAKVVAHGLEVLGDYGAFQYVNALTKYHNTVQGDDGSAMLTALTKCDLTSWCAELELWNATMTMEAFPIALSAGKSSHTTAQRSTLNLLSRGH